LFRPQQNHGGERDPASEGVRTKGKEKETKGMVRRLRPSILMDSEGRRTRGGEQRPPSENNQGPGKAHGFYPPPRQSM